MEIILNHHLASIDLQNNTGVFQYCTDKCTEWVTVNVAIDPLLMYRIQHRNGKDKLPLNIDYVGHVFQAPYRGGTYADSPFRLVCFKPAEGSDVPENYKLEPVDKGYGEQVRDALLNKVIGYNNVWRKAEQYVRYEEHKITKMLKDLSEGVNIVQPNVQFIPFPK